MTRLLVLSFLFISCSVIAQYKWQDIVELPRTAIHKLEVQNSSTTTLVSSTFAKQSVQDKVKLPELAILKVYYVFTKYRQSPSFDQRKLDNQRFALLNEHFPTLLDDPLIEWEIIEQSGASSPEEGRNYFHGFVLVHRPVLTEEERFEQIEKLTAFMDGDEETWSEENEDLVQRQLKLKDAETIDSQSENTEENTNSYRPEYAEGNQALYKYFQKNMVNTAQISTSRYDEWVDMNVPISREGVVGSPTFVGDYPDYVQKQMKDVFFAMPNWTPAIVEGDSVDTIINLQVRASYSSDVKGMFQRDHLPPDFTSTELGNQESSDKRPVDWEKIREVVVTNSDVYKGLDLIQTGERAALVMDVTGSMHSHIASMKRWIEMQNDSVDFTSYTFFNDGDNKPTREKKLGRTGGVYSTLNIEEIGSLIKTTMAKGGGGERSESDLEALLYAQTHDMVCDRIVLIGDNYSEIRDLKLIEEVKMPVDVVICAASKTVRSDYLTLAKVTGGQLIWNGKTVPLDRLSKGDQIQVGEVRYQWDGDEFVEPRR